MGGCCEDDDEDNNNGGGGGGGGGEVHPKKAQKDAAEPFPWSRTESVLKTEILSLTEHLQRNPTYEKGQGRPLPAQGAPLTNLPTVK